MKLVYIALALLLVLAAAMSTEALGGWSRQEPSNQEFRDLWAEKVSGLFLNQLNDPNIDQINTRPFIVGISTQVVAGLNINYSIKFNNKNYEVKVFRDLKGEVSITSVTMP